MGKKTTAADLRNRICVLEAEILDLQDTLHFYIKEEDRLPFTAHFDRMNVEMGIVFKTIQVFFLRKRLARAIKRE